MNNIFSQWKVKECLHCLLPVKGGVMTGNERKAEVLNAFFVSVINIKTCCPYDTQLLEQSW